MMISKNNRDITSTHLPRYLIVDILRHRYTNLLQDDNDGINIGALTRTLNYLNQIIVEDEDISKITRYLSVLGEFDYKKTDDFEELDVEKNILGEKTITNYRLFSRKKYFFPIDKNREYSLIFDHRSVCQIKTSHPEINDIQLLPQGQRIILTEEAEKSGFTELDDFPGCNFFPKNPTDLLESCFSDPALFDKKQTWDEDIWTSRWLDISAENIEIKVYSKYLQSEWKRGGLSGWSSDLISGLQVGKGEEKCIYSIEQLFRTLPDDIDDTVDRVVFLRAFKLHRNKNNETKTVVLFHPEKKEHTLFPFMNYSKSLPKKERENGRFDLLRHVLRAYIFSVREPSVVEAHDVHLLPWVFRRHLIDDDGLCREIENFLENKGKSDSKMYFTNMLRKSLWLEEK